MTRLGAVALAVVLGLGACTSKMRAKRLLGKYEQVFATCRKLTEEAGARPGEHSCAKVASLAVEGSLSDTGLPEAEWRLMLYEWLQDTGLTAYYIDSSKPAADSAPLAPATSGAPAASAGTSPLSSPKGASPRPASAAPSAAVAAAPSSAAAPAAQDAAAYAVGTKASVEWHGKWWPATVIGVQGDKYLIHYDGWSSSWDEWVTAARMRPR